MDILKGASTPKERKKKFKNSSTKVRQFSNILSFHDFFHNFPTFQKINFFFNLIFFQKFQKLKKNPKIPKYGAAEATGS
jgi:hypothetical protein